MKKEMAMLRVGYTFVFAMLLPTASIAHGRCIRGHVDIDIVDKEGNLHVKAYTSASHAVSKEYEECLRKEREALALEYASKKSAELAEKASKRAAEGAIAAHGDVALGVGGSRNENVDKIGGKIVEVTGRMPQTNGIAAKLADIATRSAVDVNSRAVGSFEAEMRNFGGVDVPRTSGVSHPAPSFAHVPAPRAEPDIALLSNTFAAAAANAGAKGVSDVRASDRQLQQSGFINRVGEAVSNYNASVNRSNEEISSQLAEDSQSLASFRERRDNALAEAAARSSSISTSTASPTSTHSPSSAYIYSSSSSSSNSPKAVSDCPNGGQRQANSKCSHELGTQSR